MKWTHCLYHPFSGIRLVTSSAPCLRIVGFEPGEFLATYEAELKGERSQKYGYDAEVLWEVEQSQKYGYGVQFAEMDSLVVV
jgi:hypothetical protein